PLASFGCGVAFENTANPTTKTPQGASLREIANDNAHAKTKRPTNPTTHHKKRQLQR
ncbi:hypothetical protein HMPREF1417_00546, partial [Helicobacter pylori GAM260Bi]